MEKAGSTMSKQISIKTLLCLILFYLQQAGADCGVSSTGYTLACDDGYHCCSKEDHTCCRDGSVCMGDRCLGWRAMIGVVAGCLFGLALVGYTVLHLGNL